jgi:hypothetical protein
MSRIDKVVKFEALWSLWNLVWGVLVEWGVKAALAAMLIAITVAVYNAFAWISGYGWAGWILAAVTAGIILAVLVGIAAWAYERILAARSRRTALVNPIHAASPEPAENASYMVEIAPILKALQVAVSLEDRFCETKNIVDALAQQQATFFEQQSKSQDQIRKAVIARRRLERAERIYSEVDRLYQLLDHKNPSIDWENWQTNANSFQMRVQEYFSEILADDPTAKTVFLMSADDLSPSRWAALNEVNFPDEDKRHRYKSIAVLHERFRGYHGRLRQQCERRLDFDLG